MSDDVAAPARALLLQRLEGVLCTHSQDVAGYPFGSVVHYLPGADGCPLLLISGLAQHTANLAADGRCALTVVGAGVTNVQQAARLTWMGDAAPLPEPGEDIVRRFLSYWPESEEYLQLDFSFWRIGLHMARFIGGFGKIYWVPVARLPRANPFFGAAETSMVEHMNEDHVDAMRRYCALAGVTPVDEPRMAGVDAEGFHLRVDGRLLRFSFPVPADTPGAVRAQLVELARA